MSPVDIRAIYERAPDPHDPTGAPRVRWGFHARFDRAAGHPTPFGSALTAEAGPTGAFDGPAAASRLPASTARRGASAPAMAPVFAGRLADRWARATSEPDLPMLAYDARGGVLPLPLLAGGAPHLGTLFDRRV